MRNHSSFKTNKQAKKLWREGVRKILIWCNLLGAKVPDSLASCLPVTHLISVIQLQEEKVSHWCSFLALMDFGTMLLKDVWAQRAEGWGWSSKPHFELLSTSLMCLLHFPSPGDFFFYYDAWIIVLHYPHFTNKKNKALKNHCTLPKPWAWHFQGFWSCPETLLIESHHEPAKTFYLMQEILAT